MRASSILWRVVRKGSLIRDYLSRDFGATGGFLGGASGKELPCQCRRHKRCGVDPWVRKIPWRRA